MRINGLLKKSWYIQGINAAPAYLAAGPVSGIYGCKDTLGYGYSSFIMHAKKEYIDLYYSKDELYFMHREFMKSYRKDKKYLEWLWRKSEVQKKPLMSFAIPSLKELSDEELIASYKEAIAKFYSCFGASHLVEAISLVSDSIIKDSLLNELERKSKADQFTYFLNILMQPTMEFFISSFQRSLLEVKQKKKRIEEHLKEFFWIKSDWSSGTTYTKKMALEDIKEAGKNTFTERQLAINKSAKLKAYKELCLSKELRNLFEILDFVSYWQDSRKTVMLTGCWLIEKYSEEISTRAKIKPVLLKYMLPDEINSIASINKRILEQRRNGSLYLYSGKVRKILTGEKYIIFMKQLSKHENSNIVREITGICASIGKAIGRVNICLKKEDIVLVKEGDILVTTMTRPEFLPAMRKARAIVTDEGALTCHAAIISRELGKPCIIATRSATKLLKNGQVVEVNANHNMVRVL